MKTGIGIILIAGALFLGYLGVTGLQESSKAVNILGIELRAEDQGAKETSYVQLGLALVALVGGVYLVGNKKK
ncbi:hypothetical protein [Limibacterium fermenti]|uniref:hypothetical protein n=1 Tax=Limibacterium fermenti TaxID=3229863 RepID=UPI000E85D8E0|nr:hypothetical protein [Porphyromonadaceae bacterium]HBK30508.1 hypothetical protein [Porphyromonadaceae bacterium]HBX45917.1 hypothetical protein [Porphyromonadaceae bacterium]